MEGTSNLPADVFRKAGAGAWTDLGDGIRRSILVHDAAMMMVRVAFERGAVGTRHRHPHTQATMVLSGRFDVTIDGRTERLGPGDSFIVPSGTLHGAVAVEAGELLDVFAPARGDFLE